jgi:hypothetical protein
MWRICKKSAKNNAAAKSTQHCLIGQQVQAGALTKRSNALAKQTKGCLLLLLQHLLL